MSDTTEAPPPKKKSDLGPRLVTAVVAIPILLAVIFAQGDLWFYLLVLWAAITSVWEYCNITYGKEHKAGVWVTSLVGGAVFSAMYWRPEFFLASLVVAALFVFLFFLFRYRDQAQSSHQIGSSITGIVYGAVMFGTIGLLHKDAGPAGPLWIFLVLCLVWLSDTGAYAAGRMFGKRKLYPAVSPNKSVEGALGGFLVSVGTVFGLNELFPHLVENYAFVSDTLALDWTRLSALEVLLVAVPGNLLAQCGDLAESLIKRAHGVKDSGTIIYGHGGILDRIDALIFATPWVYICYSTFL